jgi:hypothetical protein
MKKIVDRSVEKKKYYIVRTYSAGVFAGYIKSRKGREVVMTDARRLYQWSGAATLSELAQRGSSAPAKCLFPIAVDEVTLLEVIEILAVTRAAQKNLETVPVWSA